MMTPTPQGEIATQHPVLLPIMAPRLQADLHPGSYVDLALWGSGSLGRVRFSALPGPYVYGPNRLIAKSGGGYVAQSKPIMLLQNVKL